jgi:hypothetical protein
MLEVCQPTGKREQTLTCGCCELNFKKVHVALKTFFRECEAYFC